jgi:hypothetical protein
MARDEQANLEKWRKKRATLRRRDREEITDLPHPVRIAMARKWIEGLTWEEIAKQSGRSQKALEAWAKSPAARKWRAALTEDLDDPTKIAELVIRSSLVGVTLGYMAAYDLAQQEGDYKEIGIMSRDLLDREGVTKKGTPASVAGATINITLQAGDVEPVAIESEAVEVEVVEDD